MAMQAETAPAEMSGAKAVQFIGIGVFLWFAAAFWLRDWAPAFYDLGAGHLVAFAVTTLTAPLFVWGAAKVTSTPLNRMVSPAAIVAATAACLDGIAITYFPAFYAGEGPHLAHTGAQLLWGIGLALISALAFSARR